MIGKMWHGAIIAGLDQYQFISFFRVRPSIKKMTASTAKICMRWPGSHTKKLMAHPIMRITAMIYRTVRMIIPDSKNKKTREPVARYYTFRKFFGCVTFFNGRIFAYFY
jgi:hypothetical protein